MEEPKPHIYLYGTRKRRGIQTNSILAFSSLSTLLDYICWDMTNNRLSKLKGRQLDDVPIEELLKSRYLYAGIYKAPLDPIGNRYEMVFCEKIKLEELIKLFKDNKEDLSEVPRDRRYRSMRL